MSTIKVRSVNTLIGEENYLIVFNDSVYLNFFQAICNINNLTYNTKEIMNTVFGIHAEFTSRKNAVVKCNSLAPHLRPSAVIARATASKSFGSTNRRL